MFASSCQMLITILAKYNSIIDRVKNKTQKVMAKQKSTYEDYIFSQIRWKQQIFTYSTTNIVVKKLLENIFVNESLIDRKGSDIADRFSLTDIGWSIKQQSLFIESLLLNVALHANSIITLKIPEAHRQNPKEKYLLIDGKKRILTLQRFINNIFPLQRDYLSLLEFTTVFYKDLPEDIRGKLFLHTSLRVVGFECEEDTNDFERIAKMLRDRFSP